jgi:hypothetical protein
MVNLTPNPLVVCNNRTKRGFKSFLFRNNYVLVDSNLVLPMYRSSSPSPSKVLNRERFGYVK